MHKKVDLGVVAGVRKRTASRGEDKDSQDMT